VDFSFQQEFGALTDALKTLAHDLLSAWLAVQIAEIALAAALAAAAAKVAQRRIDLTGLMINWPTPMRLFARLLVVNIGTLVFVFVISVMHGVMLSLTWPSRSYLLGVAASLATAWFVIAMVAGLIRNQFVYRLVAISAWTLAALSILGLLQPTMAALDSVAVIVGGLRISPLLVLKTAILLMLALWAASAAGDFLDKRVRNATELTPSIQVLIGKVTRLLLITFAILITLSTVGIDLSALAFFSGAIGVGIGFGLQKIVSNLVSGIILLADKSIKPGDIINVGDQFGWVTNMGARYTSVDTRDGREILVPNEDFVTQRVVNWSYSNNRMMLISRFGVSYDSDPHQVCAVAIGAAAGVARVMADPAPVCYFEAFGESSLDFSLRYWIADPDNGIINVRAPVMMALWDAFKREGIDIPFPVRDLRITQAPPPERPKDRALRRLALRQEVAHAVERLEDVLGRVGIR
jgi:small-conductance mechanosensitive channel